MAVVSTTVLKSFFQTGDFPTQSQFAALIDSFIHRISDRYLLGLKIYDPLQGYLTGDSVIYNNQIFVANAATGPGAFNPLAWNLVTGATPGSVKFRGAWNADTNDPDLVSPIPPIAPILAGDYFMVSVEGETDLDGITDWQPGDWAIYDGTSWGKIDTTNGVSDGENVGGAVELFKTKVNTLLQFKTLLSSNGSVIIDGAAADTVDLKMNLDDLATSLNSTWSSSKIQDKLDEKVTALITAVPGNLPVFNAGGQLSDSGLTTSDFLPSTTVAADIDITAIAGISATQVQGALEELQANKMPMIAGVSGNFPYFDGTGTIYNSGYNYASFMPKIIGVANNFPYFDGTGVIYNSGYNFSSFLPAGTAASGIPVSPAVEGGTNVQTALTNLSANKIAVGSGPSAVGLGNVTNDRQLSSKHYEEKASFSSNSTSAVNAFTSPSPSLAAGDYYLDWYLEYTATAVTIVVDVEIKAMIDVALVSVGHCQLKVRSSDDFDAYSGFVKLPGVTSGIKNFTIDIFRAAGGNNGSSMTIRKMRFRLVKI